MTSQAGNVRPMTCRDATPLGLGRELTRYPRASRMGTTARPFNPTTSFIPFDLHLGNLQ